MLGETRHYLALTLVMLAGQDRTPPMAHAITWFERRGDGALGPGVYPILLELDEQLWEQGRYTDELTGLTLLLQHFPDSPEAPDLQHKVMRLHYLSDEPDPEAAAVARAALVERYREGTSWWRANLGDPEALHRAMAYVADSLLESARAQQGEADRLAPPGDFGIEPARSRYLKAAFELLAVREDADEDLPRKLFLAAELCLFHNHFDEGEARCRRLIERYPDRHYAALSASYLALAALKTGRHEQAIELCDEFLDRQDLGDDDALWGEQQTRLRFARMAAARLLEQRPSEEEPGRGGRKRRGRR